LESYESGVGEAVFPDIEEAWVQSLVFSASASLAMANELFVDLGDGDFDVFNVESNDGVGSRGGGGRRRRVDGFVSCGEADLLLDFPDFFYEIKPEAGFFVVVDAAAIGGNLDVMPMAEESWIQI
jgi:hypothetical protein